jgi:hypothetical protein
MFTRYSLDKVIMRWYLVIYIFYVLTRVTIWFTFAWIIWCKGAVRLWSYSLLRWERNGPINVWPATSPKEFGLADLQWHALNPFPIPNKIPRYNNTLSLHIYVRITNSQKVWHICYSLYVSDNHPYPGSLVHLLFVIVSDDLTYALHFAAGEKRRQFLEIYGKPLNVHTWATSGWWSD